MTAIFGTDASDATSEYVNYRSEQNKNPNNGHCDRSLPTLLHIAHPNGMDNMDECGRIFM